MGGGRTGKVGHLANRQESLNSGDTGDAVKMMFVHLLFFSD